MRPKSALRRNEINEFITRLYDGDLHAKRVLSRWPTGHWEC